jgi:carboxylate-amine ligase
MVMAESTPVGTTTVPDEMAEQAEALDLLTLGVEEEYLLVAADGPSAVPVVEDVVDRVPEELRHAVQHEFQRSQIEVASPPQLDMREMWNALTRLRTGLADAADQAGARLVAVGTGPAAGAPIDVVDRPRYHRMRERYGDLSPGQGMNGMHVHVSIPDPETGVQVLNHLRPWLPILQAATANSPFYDGSDTGYASWRSVMWERWPTVGPTPYLEDHAQYEQMLADLVVSGAMLDEGMLYWYARLAANYPTVELRMGDVCADLDITMLLASLARGLVATILNDIRDGVPAPRISHHLLVAAHWRAAHDGLEGLAVDLETRQTRPAWHLLRRLFDRVAPELGRHGDLEMATVLMARLRAKGSGAARQRAIFADQGDMDALVTSLATQTRPAAA